MNKFKYIMCVAMIALTVTSCRKTLELVPEDYFGDNNFWQNESQVTNFMVGIHKQFSDNQLQFIRLGEMRGGGFSNVDRQNTSLNELPIIEQRIDENSTGVTSWAVFYNPILQINLFIQKAEAIDFLAEVVRKNNLPPKVLVVHRFTQGMVTGYERIKKVPEVQIVMDMDGFGDKILKRSTYLRYIYKEPVQFTGFKLFYKNDTKNTSGIYTPQELLKFTPKPAYIQYQ